MGNSIGKDLRHSARHATLIGVLSFALAMGISVGSEFFLSRIVSIGLSFILLLVLILIGIVFDIVGISTAAATETPFHAKASKKVVGSTQALWLVRNADRVANFCNDVVGDICSAAAGAVGATIAFRLSQLPGAEGIYWGTLMTGMVAGLTVGGKALGKTMAINHCHDIIYVVARWVARLEAMTGWKMFQLTRKKAKKKPEAHSELFRF